MTPPRKRTRAEHVENAGALVIIAAGILFPVAIFFLDFLPKHY